MIWWLRAHRFHIPVLVSAVVCVATWLAATGVALDGIVASPIKAGVAVPVILWAPVAVPASLCASLAIDDGRTVCGATRRSNGRAAAALVGAVVLSLCAGLLPAALADGRSVLVGRDVAGLVGLALLLRRRFGGGGASAIVSAYFVTCALLGAGPDGRAAWWAWPVADLGPADVAMASALLAAGIAATIDRVRFAPGELRADTFHPLDRGGTA